MLNLKCINYAYLDMRKHKVVLYNPQSVFYTMPLALVAVGSFLDPEKFEVVIIDHRLEKDPLKKYLRRHAMQFALLQVS